MLISISKSPALTGGEDEPERPCQADLRARLEVARETGTRMTPTPYDRLTDSVTGQSHARAVNEARILCSRCPIWRQCFRDNRDELWVQALAGTIRKPPVERDQCGTTAGYRRHLKAREQTCRPCRDAEASSKTQPRAKTTTKKTA
jgi:hypothetical protein